MPHGGRRPGAGAPKGNLNALKHGRRSRALPPTNDARFARLLLQLGPLLNRPPDDPALLSLARHVAQLSTYPPPRQVVDNSPDADRPPGTPTPAPHIRIIVRS